MNNLTGSSNSFKVSSLLSLVVHFLHAYGRRPSSELLIVSPKKLGYTQKQKNIPICKQDIWFTQAAKLHKMT